MPACGFGIYLARWVGVALRSQHLVLWWAFSISKALATASRLLFWRSFACFCALLPFVLASCLGVSVDVACACARCPLNPSIHSRKPAENCFFFVHPRILGFLSIPAEIHFRIPICPNIPYLITPFTLKPVPRHLLSRRPLHSDWVRRRPRVHVGTPAHTRAHDQPQLHSRLQPHQECVLGSLPTI